MSSSRSLFVWIFLTHQKLFDAGVCPCSGQPCQKHPSMKTATLALVKAMSMVRRGHPGTFQHTR